MVFLPINKGQRTQLNQFVIEAKDNLHLATSVNIGLHLVKRWKLQHVTTIAVTWL